MDKTNQKKRVFSGIQPSGNLHIGNYLGAITQWVPMQAEFDCIFCVVDYHAITVKQDPEQLRKKIIEVAKIYLVSGIDPKESVIFQQSDVTEHTELAWILNTITRMSDLFRMTQFKDKNKTIDIEEELEELDKFLGDFSKEDKKIRAILLDFDVKNYKKIIDDIKKIETLRNKNFIKVMAQMSKMLENSYGRGMAGVGLFDYPVLMASDILLYNTDTVPVGDDQLQHVELTRDLGKRFNQQFGETFKIPEARIIKETARIMGLDDPTKKMSKSAKSEYNYIALTDDPDKAAKKIMRAATDSGSEIKLAPDKPGISNLLSIYSSLNGKKIKEIEDNYRGRGYSDFKKDVANAVKEFLIDFQNKYTKISDKEVREILDAGAKQVAPIAKETLEKVKEKIGIK
jgi:tryptophanyl-tRNA synthetase